MIPNEGTTIRSPGLSHDWNLYPVDTSLAADGWTHVADASPDRAWWTMDEVVSMAGEPNVLAIARFIKANHPDLITDARRAPSMEALASHWVHKQGAGVRVARRDEIRNILGAGNRAFNIRVADPTSHTNGRDLGLPGVSSRRKTSRICTFTACQR